MYCIIKKIQTSLRKSWKAANFNQLALRNIFNKQDDLGTPKVHMVVAAMAEEKKVDALLFLNNILRR